MTDDADRIALDALRVLFRSAVVPVHFLHCTTCGKQVSTGYIPLPTQTPDGGLIVRAAVECPECLERRIEKDPTHDHDHPS